MFCSKCGKQIDDEAMICPSCGCATANLESKTVKDISASEKETGTLATLAVVLAVLIPLVGLILGIVGIGKYQNEKYKKRCIAAIPVSIIMMIASYAIIWGL